MSQYIEFYMKHNDEWIYLNAYSRSNPMYRILQDYVPYANGIKLTEEKIAEMLEAFNYEMSVCEKSITDAREEIGFLTKFEYNDEIAERWFEIKGTINECEEELEEIRSQKNFLSAIGSMVECQTYLDKSTTEYWVGIEWAPDYVEEGV